MGIDRRHRKGGRDGGRFTLIPNAVLESAAYIALPSGARALLLDIALQFNGANNGALVCSLAVMAPRGWTSNDVLTRNRRVLLESGFLFQTVQGQRPNRASWFALTWLALDKIEGYDAGAEKLFERSAYKRNEKPAALVPSPPPKPEKATSVSPRPPKSPPRLEIVA